MEAKRVVIDTGIFISSVTLYDLLMGANRLVNSLQLYTLNKKDFNRIV